MNAEPKTPSNRPTPTRVKPPSPEEAAALFAYLPIFSAPGYSPTRNAPNIYRREVEEFFTTLANMPWMAQFRDYDPAGRADLILGDLREVGWGLTWCYRGERFSDGFWGSVILDGTVVKLLTQLRVLLSS